MSSETKGNTASFGAGGLDIWVLNVNAEGNVIWEKTYGGELKERVLSIQQTSDGGFILVGCMCSIAEENLWVLKLDENGNISETCPPGIGVDSSAVVRDTLLALTSEEAHISEIASLFTASEMSAVPIEVSSTVETQCSR